MSLLNEVVLGRSRKAFVGEKQATFSGVIEPVPGNDNGVVHVRGFHLEDPCVSVDCEDRQRPAVFVHRKIFQSCMLIVVVGYDPRQQLVQTSAIMFHLGCSASSC